MMKPKDCWIHTLCLFLLITCFSCRQSETRSEAFANELKFNQNGKFKIVQLTDIHWINGTENCDKTQKTLGQILDQEKPDMIVFTGDIATSKDQKKAFDAVVDLAISRKIPWAYVNGNHDGEYSVERKDIIPYFQQKPYFSGSNGPENVYGYGNYVLSIKSSENNNNAANLYFFDSNAYPNDSTYGYYDWIHFSQVQWYREQSKKLKQENKGQLLPALAFFHIPIPEYIELYKSNTTVGQKNEIPFSPIINAGLYNSLIEMQDVMGTFCGHNHENSSIGVLRGIALAFGEVSGYDAYGNYDRGARVIELTEGKRKFVTWITTDSGKRFHYHYPKNNLYPTDSTVYLSSVELKSPQQGVNYNYFEETFDSAKDLLKTTAKKTGVINTISLEPTEKHEHFGFEYNTYINIPGKGLYELSTATDDNDCLLLYIDDKEVINDDQTRRNHRPHVRSITLGMEKGFHKIKILYANTANGRPPSLRVGIIGLEMNYDNVPESMLFH